MSGRLLDKEGNSGSKEWYTPKYRGSNQSMETWTLLGRNSAGLMCCAWITCKAEQNPLLGTQRAGVMGSSFLRLSEPLWSKRTIPTNQNLPPLPVCCFHRTSGEPRWEVVFPPTHLPFPSPAFLSGELSGNRREKKEFKLIPRTSLGEGLLPSLHTQRSFCPSRTRMVPLHLSVWPLEYLCVLADNCWPSYL